MAYKKIEELKEFDLSSWDYYREGYVEATRQQYALAARRKDKKPEVTHD